MTFAEHRSMFIWIIIALFFLAGMIRFWVLTYAKRKVKADRETMIANLCMLIAAFLAAQAAASALHVGEPTNVETMVQTLEDRVAGELPNYR